jgi:Uncharacterised nucleotidyltransferase
MPHRELQRAARALSCDRVSAEVIGAMRGAGIDTILLKGPSIARWLYPAGGRSYIDTDILVPACAVDHAAGVLRSLGFTDLLAGFHPRELDTHSAETTFVRRAESGHGPDGLVDLHHNLPGLPAPSEALWQAFTADAETMRIGGADVRVAGRTALALHIVLHAAQHGFHGHTGEDLSRAIAAMSADDWRDTAELAARLGVGDVLGAGLRSQAAGADLADRLGLPGRSLAESLFWPRLAPRGSASVAAFLSAPTLRQQTDQVRRALLPSPAKIRYLSGRRDSRGWALLAGYARWWRGLALAAAPAVRHAGRHRRPAGSGNTAR